MAQPWHDIVVEEPIEEAFAAFIEIRTALADYRKLRGA